MKRTFTLCVLIIISCSAYSQSWQWARQPQLTYSNQEVLGTAIAKNGDVYICGYYQTSLNIGTATTLTVNFPGDYQNYVGKYNAAGQAQWLRNVSTVTPDAMAALDVSVDTLGNCYVVSGYGYAFASPGSIFNYASLYGGFHSLTKINSLGQDVWTQNPTFAVNSSCTYESIKTDKSGNSYVTGVFNGTVTFGGVTLTSTSPCAFITKYEPTGAVVYAKQATNNVSSLGHSVDVDENGYAVIAGKFQGSVTFGTTTLFSNGMDDGFIARVDPNGNFIWAMGDGSTLNDEFYGVAIDNPRIYLTGFFNENFAFGSVAVTTNGARDILVACTDTAGNSLWAVGNGGGSADDFGYDIATDHIGGVYVSGNYNGPAQFGGTNLTGANGAFLVKYDIIGIQQWVKKVVGSLMGAAGKSLSANSTPEIAMASTFCCYGGTIDFSGSAISLNANGGPGNYGYGMYTAKLGNCSLIANAGTDVSISCSDTTSLTASGGTTYTWSPSTGLSSPNGVTVQAYPVVTTTYILNASDSTGCSDTDSITVTVTGGPAVTVTGDTTVCMGSSSQLQASGAVTYSWSPVTGLNDPSLANPVATPTTTTTYTVTGTDIFGCATNAPITLVVNPLPAVPVISANLDVLTSTAAAGYQWNLNGGPMAGATGQSHTVATNGIYTVTITDINGCSSTSAPYLFTSVGLAENNLETYISYIPNPLSEDVDVVLLNAGSTNPTLNIHDITGRLVTTLHFTSGTAKIPVSRLQPGIYLFSLVEKEMVIGSGRYVVVE